MPIGHQFSDIISNLKLHTQVYMEVDKIGEDLVEDPETKLPSLLVTISVLFSTLEASIGHLHATRQVYINKVVCFVSPFSLFQENSKE